MKKQTVEKSSGERLIATLGMTSLRVTEQTYREIIEAAAEDDRTIQNEIRYLLKLGLQKRNSEK
jgi:hypothetical protein